MGHWIDVGNKLINLDQYKKIYLTTSQFGGKVLVIDDMQFAIDNADAVYQKIKQELIRSK